LTNSETTTKTPQSVPPLKGIKYIDRYLPTCGSKKGENTHKEGELSFKDENCKEIGEKSMPAELPR